MRKYEGWTMKELMDESDRLGRKVIRNALIGAVLAIVALMLASTSLLIGALT